MKSLIAPLFTGPLEVVLADPRFAWLESPLWSESGQYLLFSDPEYVVDNITCAIPSLTENWKLFFRAPVLSVLETLPKTLKTTLRLVPIRFLQM